jgi:acyl carrier protein
MSAARPEILAIVLAAADELNADLDTPIALDGGEEASLYGREGVLDSLGLVSLVAAIEEGVQNRLGATVVLADERAVSQRESPFRTVGTLVDYIQAQL